MSAQIEPEIKKLADSLGYKVWPSSGSFPEFFATHGSNGDTIYSAKTARDALDGSYNIVHPETYSICDEKLGPLEKTDEELADEETLEGLDDEREELDELAEALSDTSSEEDGAEEAEGDTTNVTPLRPQTPPQPRLVTNTSKVGPTARSQNGVQWQIRQTYMDHPDWSPEDILKEITRLGFRSKIGAVKGVRAGTKQTLECAARIGLDLTPWK